ncbi:phosphotransferase [Nocardioides sp. URHA0020]|uniref:phosphotransferase n=1 Tax=Nocardioides sp. URHA0020 TaxID=1380392 RepID=UPI0004914DE7|nr:phosphotransferase [Nocardioides sp. URHA0020]
MGDRRLLGAADVSDEVLRAMVAALLGLDVTSLSGVRVDEVDYDLASITTAGRHRVHGTARAEGQDRPFSLFVKQVQEWSRSPFFADVPPALREEAARMVPWRTEAEVYRSDLARRLPDGLGMPRALGVYDLDEKSAAVWLEDLEVVPATWDADRYERAAHLMGRLAASRAVAPLAAVGGLEWDIGMYLRGRLAVQVVPMLHDDGLWQHPLVAAAFEPDLRQRLCAAAERLERLGAELMAAPVLTGHGDACPNNLLAVGGRPGFVLIDFNFWNPLPIGFDLAQLLVGDVQTGRRRAADLGGLGALDDRLLTSYVAGLRAEGCDVPTAVVRRAHAVQLLLFTGLSSVPWELLGAPVTDALRDVADDRAALARYSLDLLAETG